MLQDPHSAYFCIRFFPGQSRAALSGGIPPLQQPCSVLKPLLCAPGWGGPTLHKVGAAGAPQPGPQTPVTSTKTVGQTHPLGTEQALDSPFTWGDMAAPGSHSHRGHSWWSHRKSKLLPQGG